jgi:septal ring factor EnvC (AmiA/AmiB activator)
MNNRYIISALALFLSAANLNTAAAQDTTRKKPVTAAKPYTKPAIYKPGWSKPATTPAGTAPVNTDKSLSGQYQYLSSKFFNYQKPQLAAFYKNVSDTLRAERKKTRDLQRQLSAQGKTVQNLQTDASSTQQSLSELNARVDAISLLGIPVTKAMYNTIMWGLVIAFGAVAAIVIMQSGSARREAKYRIKLYDELDEEYKAYKVKANEKEKKLARELQTERNKLDELLGRG